MAETYTTQYSRSYIASPPGNNYGYGARLRQYIFDYTQVLAGAAADTILLCKLPPFSTVDMWSSWFQFSAFTATATLSIGWQAYKDEDGVTQALSAAGLLSAVLLTTAGAWAQGMLVVATPDDSLPVVGRKVFNNREPVTLYATIGVAAPGVGAILNGAFGVLTP